eukprot:scaffold124425_cov63-Phaeocystis_antarctica.AAC.2
MDPRAAARAAASPIGRGLLLRSNSLWAPLTRRLRWTAVRVAARGAASPTAADGAAVVGIVAEGVAAALHIVHQAFLLGLQLLGAFLQSPVVLVHVSLFRVAATQVELCHLRDGGANDERAHLIGGNGDRALAAHGELNHRQQPYKAHQREFLNEGHAVGPVDESNRDGDQGDKPRVALPGFHARPCIGSHHVADHVSGLGINHEGRPSARTNGLSAYWVDAHEVNQRTTGETHSQAQHDRAPRSPHIRRGNALDPHAGRETESHQENVDRKGQAEEMCCEGRLLRGVCEGAGDGVHHQDTSRRRRRLEVRVILAPGSAAAEQRCRHEQLDQKLDSIISQILRAPTVLSVRFLRGFRAYYGSSASLRCVGSSSIG